MEKPASIADLERLEADIEEALISHIDKPADDLIIADLERRKLHLICEIERYVVNTVWPPVFIELSDGMPVDSLYALPFGSNLDLRESP